MSVRILSGLPCLAILFLLFPTQSWSGELPEGVTWEVVAVYKVDDPGVDRVELGKFSMEPGATLTMPIEGYGRVLHCHTGNVHGCEPRSGDYDDLHDG